MIEHKVKGICKSKAELPIIFDDPHLQ